MFYLAIVLGVNRFFVAGNGEADVDRARQSSGHLPQDTSGTGIPGFTEGSHTLCLSVEAVHYRTVCLYVED